jgi:hypothetical protein
MILKKNKFKFKFKVGSFVSKNCTDNAPNAKISLFVKVLTLNVPIKAAK